MHAIAKSINYDSNQAFLIKCKVILKRYLGQVYVQENAVQVVFVFHYNGHSLG